MDVCDVLVGNVNGDCSSIAGFVTSGIRGSAEPEATVVDVDTQLRGSIANPTLLRRIEDEGCVGGMARAARAVTSWQPGHWRPSQKDS